MLLASTQSVIEAHAFGYSTCCYYSTPIAIYCSSILYHRAQDPPALGLGLRLQLARHRRRKGGGRGGKCPPAFFNGGASPPHFS